MYDLSRALLEYTLYGVVTIIDGDAQACIIYEDDVSTVEDTPITIIDWEDK